MCSLGSDHTAVNILETLKNSHKKLIFYAHRMAIHKWSLADAQKYNNYTLIQLLYPVKAHVTINRSKFTHHTSQYTIITTKIILAGDIKLFRTIYLRGEKVQLKNLFF